MAMTEISFGWILDIYHVSHKMSKLINCVVSLHLCNHNVNIFLTCGVAILKIIHTAE